MTLDGQRHCEEPGARKHARHDVSEIPNAGVFPEALVQPERDERQASKRDQPRQHRHEERHFPPWYVTVEPQPERQVVGGNDQHKVEADDERAPVAKDGPDRLSDVYLARVEGPR